MLITALNNPAHYPHPVDQVTLLETHISWVFLAGEYAYKIKKPLNLGFLDFSSLERRAHFCREEIRLNQRQASDLYLDVVPITGSPSQPELGGSGEPFEYAVRMRRFAREDGFDHLLAEGRLQPQHIVELAEQLAQLHQKAAVAPPDSPLGQPEQVMAPMRDNLVALQTMLTTEADQARLQRLADWTEAQGAALKSLLQQRCRDGFIRECHGDAHLGNVTLFRGRTTLFDAIEFNQEFRWIDVINDLAFTLMDLCHRGAPAMSWQVLDRYLTLSGDFQGVRLLTFYQVYRALVRAKIAGLRLGQDLDAEQQQAVLAELKAYVRLAERLAEPRRPALIITMGLSGSGKTVLSNHLLQDLGLIRLRSDVERKRLHDLAPEADSHSQVAGGIYSSDTSQLTYARLRDHAATLLQAGEPVLVDATCLQQQQRQAFRQLAQEHDVPLHLLVCEADTETLKARLHRRAAQGGDASEADTTVLEYQLAQQQPLTTTEQAEAIVLDTTRDDSVATAQRVLAYLRRTIEN